MNYFDSERIKNDKNLCTVNEFIELVKLRTVYMNGRMYLRTYNYIDDLLLLDDLVVPFYYFTVEKLGRYKNNLVLQYEKTFINEGKTEPITVYEFLKDIERSSFLKKFNHEITLLKKGLIDINFDNGNMTIEPKIYRMYQINNVEDLYEEQIYRIKSESIFNMSTYALDKE